MSDYLSNLAARALSLAPVVRPRLQSLFASEGPSLLTPVLRPDPIQELEDEVGEGEAIPSRATRRAASPSSRQTANASDLHAANFEPFSTIEAAAPNQTRRINRPVAPATPALLNAAETPRDSLPTAHSHSPAPLLSAPPERLQPPRFAPRDATLPRDPIQPRTESPPWPGANTPALVSAPSREDSAERLSTQRRPVLADALPLAANSDAPRRSPETSQGVQSAPERRGEPFQPARQPLANSVSTPTFTPTVSLKSRTREVDAPTPSAPATPTIQVTIGRLEVRATPPATPVKSARPAPPAGELQEYLRGRNKGDGG